MSENVPLTLKELQEFSEKLGSWGESLSAREQMLLGVLIASLEEVNDENDVPISVMSMRNFNTKFGGDLYGQGVRIPSSIGREGVSKIERNFPPPPSTEDGRLFAAFND